MLAMRLQKSVTAMAPQQRQQRQQRRRCPVVVLHAALLLLCLALLMRASVTSAHARPVPSEMYTEYVSNPARQLVEGGTLSQQDFPMETSSLPKSEADEDNLKDCASLPDSTSEPCVSAIDGRMLVVVVQDYGGPQGNQNPAPGGQLP